MRKSTFFWIGASLCIGMVLVMTTQKVTDTRQKLETLTANIQNEEESLRVLQAEWSYLNQPERLEKLSKQYLNLTPMTAKQFARLDDVPVKEKDAAFKETLSLEKTEPVEKTETLSLPAPTKNTAETVQVTPIAGQMFTPSLSPSKKPHVRKSIPMRATEKDVVQSTTVKPELAIKSSTPAVKPVKDTRRIGDVLHSLGVD